KPATIVGVLAMRKCRPDGAIATSSQSRPTSTPTADEMVMEPLLYAGWRRGQSPVRLFGTTTGRRAPATRRRKPGSHRAAPARGSCQIPKSTYRFDGRPLGPAHHERLREISADS